MCIRDRVYITDVNGKAVKQFDLKQNSVGLHEIDLPMSELATGNYLMSITDGKQVITKRIAKR